MTMTGSSRIEEFERLVSFNEFAKILGISRSSLQRRIDRRDVPLPVKIGTEAKKARVAFLASEIRQFLADCAARRV